jgi:hypothetical protein
MNRQNKIGAARGIGRVAVFLGWSDSDYVVAPTTTSTAATG